MLLLVILCGALGILVFWLQFLKYKKRYCHLTRAFLTNNWAALRLFLKLYNPDEGLSVALEYYNLFKRSAVINNFPACSVLAFDPKFIELVLNTNMNKSIEYSFIKSWLKTGILTSEYEKWKVRKKMLAPAFNMQSLQHHVDVFNEKSKVLSEKLLNEVENPSININTYVNLCTLDMILSTALGDNSINVQDNPTSDYMTSIKTMCDVLYRRSFSMHIFNWYYHNSRLQKREQHASEILNNFSMQFIRERRTQHVLSSSPSKTILDILLENENLNDEDISEELNTFIFAGHDTTGLTLSFALYSLSKNPDVQSRVYNEILEVVGEYNAPTYKDLENLKYTAMMLKETLRLYPAVPIFARTIHKEITWNDCVLPKGVIVYVIPYVMHRIEEVFPEPEKFDPERFSDENIGKIPNCAYLPFSSGPRNCIGQKFAALEMKTILVHLLRRYEILPAQPAHELQLVAKVTLQSKNGIKIRLKKRNAY